MADNDYQRELRIKTSDALAAGRDKPMRAFVGLDGARDVILHVVDKRKDFENYDRIKTITEYAKRIGDAAGKSANLE